MEIIKRSFILLSLFIFILTCTSCSEEIRNNKVSKSKEETIYTPNQDSTESSSYKATLGDNLLVDANVYNPSIDRAPILLARYREFDQDLICNKFLNSGYSISNEYDEFTEYTDGEGTVYFRKGSFEYSSKFADYINGLFGLTSKGRFSKDKELDFMSIDDAINLCIDCLKEISIDVYIPAEVYSLDFKSLQNEHNTKIQDEDFMFYVERGKIKLKEKWEKDDEVYYIIFRTLKNELIFDPSGYLIQDKDRPVNGNYITMIVSKDGIKECRIRGSFYEEIETRTEEQTLISFEESLNLIKNKFESIILEDKIIINEIFLSYVPVPISGNENEYNLVPSWIYKYEEKYSTTAGDVIVENYIRFNAITGEEIF